MEPITIALLASAALNTIGAVHHGGKAKQLMGKTQGQVQDTYNPAISRVNELARSFMSGSAARTGLDELRKRSIGTQRALVGMGGPQGSVLSRMLLNARATDQGINKQLQESRRLGIGLATKAEDLGVAKGRTLQDLTLLERTENKAAQEQYKKAAFKTATAAASSMSETNPSSFKDVSRLYDDSGNVDWIEMMRKGKDPILGEGLDTGIETS